MDLLTTLKNTISTKTTENLAEFLGENFSNVSTGLNLGLNSFLGGLLKYASSDAETGKILNVLKEGGHTGELLNNLDSFTANGEKSKLIITIGNNIVNHFFDNKGPIIDKIAELSNIKKTSSSSLCSFAAPVVLGLLGKLVKDRNLDASGLRNLILDNSATVTNSLPPSIASYLSLKTDPIGIAKEQPVITAQVEAAPVYTTTKKVQKKQDDFNWFSIVPWLVLGLASLFSIYYYLNVKNKPNNNVATELKQDSVETLEPKDFLPDSATSDTKVSESKPVESTHETVKEVIAPIENKVATPSPVTKTAAAPKAVTESSSKSKMVSEPKREVEEMEVSSSIPSGWNNISGKIFHNNSAEVMSNSAINQLVSRLGSNKKILIAPLSGSKSNLSEDRAYGLRDILIEKGVSENQIEIVKSVAGRDNNNIVYKIVN